MPKTIGLLIFLICCLFGTIAYTNEPINLITAIEIRGNNSVPDAEILQVVKTRVGQPVDTEQLQKDMQAIGDLGYFADLSVQFEYHLGGVKLVIKVVENPIIARIELVGSQSVTVEKLLEQMQSRVGTVLNTNTLSTDIQKIESYYSEQSLILAHVTGASISPEGVLQITVAEGIISEIRITGNEKTHEYVIRREISLKPGDVFHLNTVQKDLMQIYNLGYFEDVKPSITPDDNFPDKVVLVIQVLEQKTGDTQLGASYSTKEGLLGFFDIKETNLFGRGQELGFKWEFGQSMNYEVSFYDPWALGQPFNFGVELYNKTDRKATDSDKGTFSRNTQGASLLVGKPLAKDLRGSVKLKYEHYRNDWADANLTDESGDTRSVIFTTVHDTRDNYFNPHSGGKALLGVEYAGQLLGGNSNFTKYTFDASRYITGFKSDHTLAFRFQSGLSSGSLPANEKFHLGGSETLRGFESNSLSGNKMLLLNTEYRFPLVKNLEGTVFVDTGNAWASGNSIDLSQLKISTGLGLRMNTPLGQIQLGYAVSEKGGMPYFAIGASF